jgi:hypothetical protein
MSTSWWGIAGGSAALAIAAWNVVLHYRREHRRQQLLRNLDHHDWWYRVLFRARVRYCACRLTICATMSSVRLTSSSVVRQLHTEIRIARLPRQVVPPNHATPEA